MKHRNSHLLIGYWSRLRRDGQIPDQADIDPRGIKRMLPSVFILDAHDPACPTYRLAGTLICERFGQELRGTSFFGHWEAAARDTLQLLSARALAAKHAICLSAIGTTSHCATMEMETVLAPLTFGPGAARRFLGITSFSATHVARRPAHYLRASHRLRRDPRERDIKSAQRAAFRRTGNQAFAPAVFETGGLAGQGGGAAFHRWQWGGEADSALDIAPAIRLVR